jgi:type VI secretion system protein VasG
MNVDLRSLIGRLNDETRNAVESAAGLCVSRTHYDVEIEHFLLKLLDGTDNDLALILKHYGVDRSRFAAQLTESIDRFKSGNARTPSLSPSLMRMLTEAWLIGSVDYGAVAIRTGFTVAVLASDDELSRLIRESSPELGKIPGESLRKDFNAVVAGSVEGSGVVAPGDAPHAAKAAGGPTPGLDGFTNNITQRARDGLLDPVLSREFEIRQVVDILTRRRQNNPILVGEAGVGKTAVVEGFAMRIVEGDVPPPLQNVEIRGLDLALLQAGAGVKGEFEKRLKGLIEEVKSSPTPIILFIDEAHTMIGAGGSAGQGDAANLLKPALARGELRTIAATTWSEYKMYFEKDPALTRRFQLVKVDEPSESSCAVMMRGIAPSLEAHHGVRILDDGIEAAVRLAHRYLPDRQLPDKAVSVLDTACARLALGQSATPAAVEDARRRLDDLVVQARILERESAVGADHSGRLAEIAAERESTEKELTELGDRWERERELVVKIHALRTELEEMTTDGGARGKKADSRRQELAGLTAELEEVQGEAALVPVCVDAELVGQVVSGWTGIPVGKMLRDEVNTVLQLEKHLGERIIGQDHALEAVSHRIRTSRAGIEDPKKPVGVFMLVGPSGVGKTETALVLSDLFFGGEHNMISINMSEFQEAHTISTLKGSPPGYVGYGEGGVLTEAVRRRPYSVVLLDEVEKAHPDVLELFFQVFDKGVMEDGEGRQIDFKNTILMLTTNAGTDTIMNLTADPETAPDHLGLSKALKPELDRIFKPAFLGRLVIIPYFPIGDENMKKIVVLKLDRIQARLADAHGVDLIYDDALVQTVADRCTEVESGARNIDNILTNTMLPSISRLMLEAIVEGERPAALRVGVGANGDFEYAIDTA